MEVTVTTLVRIDNSSTLNDIAVIGDNIYGTVPSENCIIKITPNGNVSLFAGYLRGSVDGVGEDAQFNFPCGITAIGDDLYVADTYSSKIRKITPNGTVSTIAGSEVGRSDGKGIHASFMFPHDLTAIGRDLYVVDTGNSSIRKITPDGNVTTVTGIEAKLKLPVGITSIGDDLYVSDSGNNRICKITPDGNVTTVAGSDAGDSGRHDGMGTNARFSYPCGITSVGKDLYVVDNRNNRIRKITPDGNVTTIAGSMHGYKDGAGKESEFLNPTSVITVGKSLYVTDSANYCIRKIDLGIYPTNENHARKKNTLEELTYLPPMSVFPGGIAFQDAKKRFQNAQTRQRGSGKRKKTLKKTLKKGKSATYRRSMRNRRQ
jgi:hypothetical protein